MPSRPPVPPTSTSQRRASGDDQVATDGGTRSDGNASTPPNTTSIAYLDDLKFSVKDGRYASGGPVEMDGGSFTDGVYFGVDGA